MRIKGKSYAKISFEIVSPLSVGSGDNEFSDHDIVRNSRSIPYIPASAVAGVTRNACSFEDAQDKEIFGFVDVKGGSEKTDSSITFMDANLTDCNNYYVSIRDNVALDEFKTAKKGAKFDRQILEPGENLVTYIEESIIEDKEQHLEAVLQPWINGHIRFGGKTARGMGEINVKDIKIISFDLNSPEDTENWLSFNIYDENCWNGAKSLDISRSLFKSVVLELEQVGGISIRRYTTDVSETGDSSPDFTQLTVHYDKSEKPVIPGSSWAGAFRGRMEKLAKTRLPEIFGTVDEKSKKKEKSGLYFSETLIEGAKPKKLTRTAIDRFTGGSKNGALYTERSYFGGTGTLKLSWNGARPLSGNELAILAATVTDLHFGFLAVGGLSSIGRGLFRIKRINGKRLPVDTDAIVYEFIRRELEVLNE